MWGTDIMQCEDDGFWGGASRGLFVEDPMRSRLGNLGWLL